MSREYRTIQIPLITFLLYIDRLPLSHFVLQQCSIRIGPAGLSRASPRDDTTFARARGKGYPILLTDLLCYSWSFCLFPCRISRTRGGARFTMTTAGVCLVMRLKHVDLHFGPLSSWERHHPRSSPANVGTSSSYTTHSTLESNSAAGIAMPAANPDYLLALVTLPSR